MKSLRDFITEAYEEKQISDLKAVYDVLPEIFYVKCPSSYQESDVQQYLDDVLLPKLPSNQDDGQKFFGDNMNNLNDAYFEYDKFEHLSEDEDHADVSIDWDEHVASKKQNDEDTIDMFKLTNLKYILMFDEFTLMYDKEDINDVLEQIFVATESNNDNEYPAEIKFNIKETSYKR